MTQTPWRTERWSSSPWNYDPEVRAELAFADRITVHDVTLRDGEQQAGVTFTADDKLRIAHRLAEVGVHRIETGLPAATADDERATREIAAAGLPAETWAFARCILSDVELAADCGVDGLTMEIPCSRHIIEQAYGWPVEKAIELSIEATRAAHEAGLKVTFFPVDATRSSLDDFKAMISRVAAEGHMDALGLVDTFGVLTPHAVPIFVRAAREIADVPLEAHFHMDTSLGVANTLVALAQGTEVIQTTVTGIGERAGNTPLEDVALALLMHYGVDLGLRTEQFCELSALVLELAKVGVAPNRPIVGERLTNVESGIVTAWFRRALPDHPLACMPFLPELVGQRPPTTVLGKASGLDSIRDGLDRLGLEVDEDTQLALLAEVKRRALRRKGLVEPAELRAMVADGTDPGR